ncbi:hypothetical protein KR038_011610 [Drosophila bunnanda]|nr:hypothetical protein KR038_011610 [Drosophila bunnanda]
MEQTPKRTSAKGKGRVQPSAKGCCCKRSQCIKNYCDCYQSMMVCTQFCRCVGELFSHAHSNIVPWLHLSGCRNTEERMAVEPRAPSRNSNAGKRDRAAAMSAKAAAAAAKEGINIPMPPIAIVPTKKPTVMAPVNIIRMAPDSCNIVLQQVATMPPHIMPMGDTETDETPDTAMDSQNPEVEPEAKEPVEETDLHETHNLFTPEINRAQLICSLIQGSDAEELGLSPTQVGRLVIVEFGKCFKEVAEKMCNL